MQDMWKAKNGDDEVVESWNIEQKGHKFDTTAGCTATMVMITPKEIICANAGDSRTILSRKGVAEALSEDHKPDDPLEKARIEKLGGFVRSGRVFGSLAVSRSIGDFENKGLTFKDDEGKEQFHRQD